VFDKELFERGEEKIGWGVINAVLYRLTEGNKERRDEYYEQQKGCKFVVMLGGTHIEFNRCDWEMKHDFLPRIVKAIKATSSKEVVDELSGDLLYGFHRQLRQYYDKEFVASFTAVLNEYIPRKEVLAKPAKQYRTMTDEEIQDILKNGNKKID
jgi:hypothetical protein